MTSKNIRVALAAVVLTALGTTAGCELIAHPPVGPTLGLLSYPIPVSPYVQTELERNHHIEERYAKLPILPPLTEGAPCISLDPPSDDEVMVALENARQVRGGFPLLYTRQRNNVRIVKELITDKVNPPRVYPMVGPAQLHQVHYKCTIYFSETERVGWPVPYTANNQDAVEVVYIDHDHLHLVGNVNYSGDKGF